MDNKVISFDDKKKERELITEDELGITNFEKEVLYAKLREEKREEYNYARKTK